MRTLIAAFALVCAGLLLATDANFAQDKKTDKKDTVLKGKITCNKCDLGKSTECETVIVVKDEKAKKDITYFFDKASHGKFHDDICSTPKTGTVTGTVKDADKKKVITVKKVEYDK
jgi:Family of unknown function (DUF6370)